MTTFATPPDAKVTQCRSCGADVIWMARVLTRDESRRSVHGHALVRAGDDFATCPQAKEWRNR